MLRPGFNFPKSCLIVPRSAQGSVFPKSLPEFGIIPLSHLPSDGCTVAPHGSDLHASVRLGVAPTPVAFGFPLLIYLR